MRGSEIRRLFKISMRPGVISFAGGLPDPGSFPAEKVAHVSEKLLREQGERMLQYGPARGIDELIQVVVEKMAARGMRVAPEEVLIEFCGDYRMGDSSEDAAGSGRRAAEILVDKIARRPVS